MFYYDLVQILHMSCSQALNVSQFALEEIINFVNLIRGNMNKILSIVALCLVSTSAFAEVGQPLPEPGTLAIIAAGIAGMWFSRRK